VDQSTHFEFLGVCLVGTTGEDDTVKVGGSGVFERELSVEGLAGSGLDGSSGRGDDHGHHACCHELLLESRDGGVVEAGKDVDTSLSTVGSEHCGSA
jgi:hypothetical protein